MPVVPAPQPTIAPAPVRAASAATLLATSVLLVITGLATWMLVNAFGGVYDLGGWELEFDMLWLILAIASGVLVVAGAVLGALGTHRLVTRIEAKN